MNVLVQLAMRNVWSLRIGIFLNLSARPAVSCSIAWPGS